MPEPDPNAREPRDDESPDRGPERFLLPYLEDPNLRLVLLTASGVLVTFGAWLLASAIRSRSVGALLAVVAIGVASAEAIRSDLRRRRRPGPISVLIAAEWLATGTATWAALHWGLF